MCPLLTFGKQLADHLNEIFKSEGRKAVKILVVERSVFRSSTAIEFQAGPAEKQKMS